MYLSTPVNGHDGLCARGHWNTGHVTSLLLHPPVLLIKQTVHKPNLLLS